MRPWIVALILVPAMAFAAGADKIVTSPGGIEVVMPAASLVTAPIWPKAGDSFHARFSGQFVLTGTLHYDGDADNRLVFLRPDSGIAARLPRWKESATPREIWFENGEDVVRAVFGAQAAAPSGNGNRINAGNKHVSLDVDRYTIAIECDTANYTVHFLRVHTPGAVAQGVEQSEGC